MRWTFRPSSCKITPHLTSAGAHCTKGTVEEILVIILGVILLILGAVLNVPILYTIGGILVVVGAVLWILGSMDRAVGPRKHYF